MCVSRVDPLAVGSSGHRRPEYVIRLERGVVDSRSSTLGVVRRVLEAAGIELLSLREDSEGIRHSVHRGRPRPRVIGSP